MWMMHRNAAAAANGGSTLPAVVRERRAVAMHGSFAGALGSTCAQPTGLSIDGIDVADVPAQGDVCPHLEAIV